VVDVPALPAVRIERATAEDHRDIAALTVSVYVDGGLANPEYSVELADVAGRADRAELLVVRDEAGRLVGSVALVLDGDFGSPAYAAELADVTGRATRARLLVAADEQQRIVGSVALVLEGDLGEVTRNPRRPRSGCWWSTPSRRVAASARCWSASAWSGPVRRASAGWCSRPARR
jgi:hypothetical protein